MRWATTTFCWPSSMAAAYFGLPSASHLRSSISRSRVTGLTSLVRGLSQIVAPPEPTSVDDLLLLQSGCSRAGLGERLDSHGCERARGGAAAGATRAAC